MQKDSYEKREIANISIYRQETNDLHLRLHSQINVSKYVEMQKRK